MDALPAPERAVPAAPVPFALADTPSLANPRPADDPHDIAFSATDAPPAVEETVDPFASTANPSDGMLRAAAASAAHVADTGRVSPLASSSFDLGADPGPVSRGPLPAAGSPPRSIEAAGPMSSSGGPRSKHGSTVLLSAMPSRAAALKPSPAQAPAPAPAHVAAPLPAPMPAHAPPPVQAPIHAPPPASGYMPGPQSIGGSPPSSIAGHGILPGARVIVTFPNGQRVFGTIWQCAQAHYLVQFPDGKSQWVETALVRSV